MGGRRTRLETVDTVGAGDNVEGVARVVVHSVVGHLQRRRPLNELGGDSDGRGDEGKSREEDSEELHGGCENLLREGR